jgi:hypothetical protein
LEQQSVEGPLEQRMEARLLQELVLSQAALQLALLQLQGLRMVLILELFVVGLL